MKWIEGRRWIILGLFNFSMKVATEECYPSHYVRLLTWHLCKFDHTTTGCLLLHIGPVSCLININRSL